jgi:hypothetical protein
MKKSRMRSYKKRRSRRRTRCVRKGGAFFDNRVGAPLPLSDMVDSMRSSAISLNKSVLGNY